MRRFLLVSLLFAGGCSHDASAQKAAEYFLDKYYIEVDHDAALEVAEGPAAERVRREAEDLKQARRIGVGMPALPRVYYKKLSQAASTQGERFVYVLDIDSAGARLSKEVTLTVVRNGARFRVQSIEERDTST